MTDYFKQKMQAKLQPEAEEGFRNSGKIKKPKRLCSDLAASQEEESVESDLPKKKKRKRTLSDTRVELIEEVLDEAEDITRKKKKKKSKNIQNEDLTPADAEEDILTQESNEEQTKKIKKKSKREDDLAEILQDDSVEEKPKKSKKKAKRDKEDESAAPEKIQSASEAPPKRSGEPDRPTGANAVYSTNVIQIPSHVAQKMSNMIVDKFRNANIANIVGYGLSEDIEMKIVQTKIGDNSVNTDKYSLYNMDRMTTRQRVNPRKIISKIKRTKKSIQVI